MLREALEGLVDLLAPRCCAGCDEVLSRDQRAFCDTCAGMLDRAGAAFEPPRDDASLYVYGGPIRDAIRKLKYGRRGDLVGPLGDVCAGAALAYGGEIDAVVPVPLHPRRLRERGFDQAALLARPIAAALAVPCGVGALRRVRHTEAQAGLDAPARDRNVRGAFAAKKALTWRRVLLFDDVRTTGATLAAAARALREAGVPEVRTLSLARATTAPTRS